VIEFLGATILGVPEWHADPEELTFTAVANGRQYCCVMPRGTFHAYRLPLRAWDRENAQACFENYRSGIEHLVGEMIRHSDVPPGDPVVVR
jgi:hypothetical protein